MMTRNTIILPKTSKTTAKTATGRSKILVVRLPPLPGPATIEHLGGAIEHSVRQLDSHGGGRRLVPDEVDGL